MSGAPNSFPPGEAPAAEAREEAALARELAPDSAPLDIALDEPPAEPARVARGADLFIAECYYYDKPIKWHLNYPTVAAQRDAFGARRVILTHMSREMLAHADTVPEECAHDGLVVTL